MILNITTNLFGRTTIQYPTAYNSTYSVTNKRLIFGTFVFGTKFTLRSIVSKNFIKI